MTTLEELAPKRRDKVIDLVHQAGVDVSDWANFKGGPQKASTNPKYCYEWSFVQPDRVVVLNLWFGDMAQSDGIVSYRVRPRASEGRNRSGGHAVWAARRKRMDEAIEYAFRNGIPVRAIICDGNRRNSKDKEPKASQVTKRQLDPVSWAVSACDQRTGACTLTRGAAPPRYVDQFSIFPDSPAVPERRAVSGEIFVRSKEVRANVLARAAGVCEWCNQPGFKTLDGGVFLETHHVIPLSESGADHELNVVALCPNHHREAHHGAAQKVMRSKLLSYLSEAIAGQAHPAAAKKRRG